MKKKKPIKIYWSPEMYVEKAMTSVLFKLKPEKLIFNNLNKNSLMADLHKNRNDPNEPLLSNKTLEHVDTDRYQLCAALHNLVDSTYIFRAPFDADINFNDDYLIIRNEQNSHFWGNRDGSFKNNAAADLLLGFIMFSEESLDFSITPPYMHKTSQPDWGFLCSVKWDIGKWLRPVVFIFQLWEGKKRLYFKAGEPLAYFTFHTDRPIEFIEFKMTSEIHEMIQACLRHKTIIKFEKLYEIYDRFISGGMRNRALIEIKKNIIKQEH
jgi:ABC-type dipeptide/oligopeptide/nickel transport system ATPase component